MAFLTRQLALPAASSCIRDALAKSLLANTAAKVVGHPLINDCVRRITSSATSFQAPIVATGPSLTSREQIATVLSAPDNVLGPGQPLLSIRRPYATTSKAWRPTSISVITLPGDFTTVLGATIGNVKLRVESHGLCSLPASRTVVIFPSFSHSSHVASNADDPSPGWWQDMVGPDKPIDTRHWRVLCISVLGSPSCPTNPATVDPATGKQYRARFPQLSPTDLARCHASALRLLGFSIPAESQAPDNGGGSGKGAPSPLPSAEPLHAVVGSSLGGMQALQFASLYPSALSRLVSVASTGRTTPFTVGIRRAQRRAILADRDFAGGDYADVPGRGPWEGLKQAREIGTLFYRSREEFDRRFAWSPSGDRHFTSLDTWEVESYLTYAGNKFARTYDANAYLLLSKCMDLQDLGDGAAGRATYAEGAGRITADTLLVGVTQDALIPPGELAQLADTMRANGSAARVEYAAMNSEYGHDAFLKETAWLGPRIRAHLERGLERHLEEERLINTGVNAP